jgi:hypothetical protein
MDRINIAVREERGIEPGGLFGVSIEPEARGYAKHGDFPPKSGRLGGLIGFLDIKVLPGSDDGLIRAMQPS